MTSCLATNWPSLYPTKAVAVSLQEEKQTGVTHTHTYDHSSIHNPTITHSSSYITFLVELCGGSRDVRQLKEKWTCENVCYERLPCFATRKELINTASASNCLGQIRSTRKSPGLIDEEPTLFPSVEDSLQWMPSTTFQTGYGGNAKQTL